MGPLVVGAIKALHTTTRTALPTFPARGNGQPCAETQRPINAVTAERASGSRVGSSSTAVSIPDRPLTCTNRPANRSRSPDRIRTGATALRGRRPRPLDDGARRLAGVPGLEPRLTGPEPVGLPITPHPTGPSGPQPSGPGWMPDRLAALGLAHDSG